MPKLRDGSTVKDSRLNRLRQFDEKSRDYPIRAVVKRTKPRSYTWPCLQHLDQGKEGACVGFSMTHELIAKPVAVKGLNAKFATEKIYWEAQRSDPWEGGSYPGAKPVYEGTSVLAGIKVVKALGFIEEYRWAFSLEDLILAVGHAGPAVIGVNWYDGMFDVHQCGYIHVTGELAGGHAILVKGVNVKAKYFVLHNSWGPKWGTNGDGKLGWDDMDRLLHEGGEAVIPIQRRTPV